MVDYDAASGSGLIRIRDNGSTIEFMIQAGSSATFDHGLQWSGVVNGAAVSGTFDYQAGAGLVSVASYSVTTNQNVSFSIYNTGTSGLGGPTTVNATINRATVPAAPTAVGFTSVGHTTLTAQFVGNSDGGAPILQWQYQGADNPDFSGVGVADAGTTGLLNIGGLTPGKTYYFRFRGVNSVGASDWSNVISVRTLAGARVKVNGVWKEAVVYVKVDGTWRPCIPYVKVSGQWHPAG